MCYTNYQRGTYTFVLFYVTDETYYRCQIVYTLIVICLQDSANLNNNNKILIFNNQLDKIVWVIRKLNSTNA